MVSPKAFIDAYEAALASQDWTAVDPLVHEDVCVTFSSGAVQLGKAAVRAAFEANFASIHDEEYRMSEIHIAAQTDAMAAYLFRFEWTGVIDGEAASGAGRGTSILVNDGDGWKLLAEHLGPA